MKEDELEP